MNAKQKWIVWAGEGEEGHKTIYNATEIGIKRILTRERCGGDRWAHATLASRIPDGNRHDNCGTARDFSLDY